MSVLYKITIAVVVFVAFTIAVLVESGIEYRSSDKNAVNGLYCLQNCDGLEFSVDKPSYTIELEDGLKCLAGCGGMLHSGGEGW